jgi:hypothetical protein
MKTPYLIFLSFLTIMLCSERGVEGSLKASSGATFKEMACNVTAEYEIEEGVKVLALCLYTTTL